MADRATSRAAALPQLYLFFHLWRDAPSPLEKAAATDMGLQTAQEDAETPDALCQPDRLLQLRAFAAWFQVVNAATWKDAMETALEELSARWQTAAEVRLLVSRAMAGWQRVCSMSAASCLRAMGVVQGRERLLAITVLAMWRAVCSDRRWIWALRVTSQGLAILSVQERLKLRSFAQRSHTRLLLVKALGAWLHLCRELKYLQHLGDALVAANTWRTAAAVLNAWRQEFQARPARKALNTRSAVQITRSHLVSELQESAIMELARTGNTRSRVLRAIAHGVAEVDLQHLAATLQACLSRVSLPLVLGAWHHTASSRRGKRALSTQDQAAQVKTQELASGSPRSQALEERRTRAMDWDQVFTRRLLSRSFFSWAASRNTALSAREALALLGPGCSFGRGAS